MTPAPTVMTGTVDLDAIEARARDQESLNGFVIVSAAQMLALVATIRALEAERDAMREVFANIAEQHAIDAARVHDQATSPRQREIWEGRTSMASGIAHAIRRCRAAALVHPMAETERG